MSAYVETQWRELTENPYRKVRFHVKQEQSQSLGAQRVRESFNPSGDGMVDRIKRYTADLIDLCEDMKHIDPRLAALAQTAYEEAAMWAVKCATTDQALRQASNPLK